jgi:Predicted hydrolases or acyltransferases (alpha/beta hydrolase superfamily)
MHGSVSRLFRLLPLILIVFLVACATRPVSVPTLPVQTVRVDDLRVGYRVAGTGDPLLMVMGYAGTMDAWDSALIDRLARTRKVILFDNRNTGYTATTDAPVSVAGMARDALGLLTALGIERADVMGWSMGSIIAQEMALTRPDMVGKLVLYGTVCDPAPVNAALDRFASMSPEQFAANLFPKAWADANPDVYSRLPSPAIPPTAEAVARQRAALAKWPGTRDRLPGLISPVLILEGEDDGVTPLEQSLQAASLIRNAWLARFGGGGHWMMYQTPEDMAAVIETFLMVRQNLLP